MELSQPKKECKTCKKKITDVHWSFLIFTGYTMFSIGYTTVQLIKWIASLF
jgi:hypothetical protein